MIVTCDQCGQRARIKAEKLPPQGGKIRCPQCSNVIIVKPPGGARTAPGKDAAPKTTESEVVTSSDSPAAPPAPAASKPAQKKPVPTSSSSEESPSGATWKLRVSGLTYSFQTLDSLHQWLNGRDSLDGIRVARNTDDWHELGDYPEVLSDAMKLRFFPDGQVPTTSSVANEATKPGGEAPPEPETPAREPRTSNRDMAAEAAARRSRRSTNRKMADAGGSRRGQSRRSTGGGRRKPSPKSESSGGGSRVGFYVGILLLTLAVGGGLHFSGVIDLGIILPTQPEQEPILEATPEERAALASEETARTPGPDEDNDTDAVETAPTPSPVDEIDPEEEARLEAELVAEQLARLEATMTRADELMSERRWAEARAVLEPQAKLWPDHLAVNAALLRVYEKLGKREEAGEQRELVELLETQAEADGGDTE